MTIPAYDGCTWPTDFGQYDDSWASDFDADTQNRSIALASNTLRRLTAFRVGGCPIKIRPCGGGGSWQAYRMGAYVNGHPVGDPWIPMNWKGTWTNLCGCTGGCACMSPGSVIRLPRPVIRVTEVKQNGTVLTAGTQYRVSVPMIYGLGGQVFLQTQDLSLPDTATNTLSVTYYDSYDVDGLGAYACGLLAYEYAQATKSGKCKLPATVTQVVRQGVSYSIPAGAFPNGETGIREVDAFIALWNPGHRPQRTKVWSP